MSDVIFGPLDESEEAVAAVNDFAEKNDDPDMQVENVWKIKRKRTDFRCFLSVLDAGKCSRPIERRMLQLF